MSWLWLSQEVANVTWLKKAVQLRLRDVTSEWQLGEVTLLQNLNAIAT